VLETPEETVAIAMQFGQVRLELGITTDDSKQEPIIVTKERATWIRLKACLRNSLLEKEARLLSKMMDREVLSKLHQVLSGSVHTSLVEHSETSDVCTEPNRS